LTSDRPEWRTKTYVVDPNLVETSVDGDDDNDNDESKRLRVKSKIDKCF
jgi:hypothetical protein